MPVEMALIRAVFVIVLVIASYHLRPFQMDPLTSALLGALLGITFVLVELRLEKASLKKIIGGALGSTAGILGSVALFHFLKLKTFDRSTVAYIKLTALLLMGYIGLNVGAQRGENVTLQAIRGYFKPADPPSNNYKILDTSVIIDGRIADVCETGFIDGTLVIPKFVLRELQLVADSSDSGKRNRGRRGLDILAVMQKMETVTVLIIEDDFPHIRDVDMKLLELAKKYQAKIVTNDFNLNKIAQLQGLPVLNVNELANTLKPIVLPGETMRVYILKEGKEFNQGVAYLDDGTMVVVDNARKMIAKTIDISVTSVLQTTAGKMIFGKYDDRQRAEALAAGS